MREWIQKYPDGLRVQIGNPQSAVHGGVGTVLEYLDGIYFIDLGDGREATATFEQLSGAFLSDPTKEPA